MGWEQEGLAERISPEGLAGSAGLQEGGLTTQGTEAKAGWEPGAMASKFVI